MKKILVVDDEKLIVKSITFSLQQEGWQVDSAYDGGEALEKAKSQEYDLILLDVMLPVMEGTEVCRMIREFSNVPIIMLTAKNSDMDKILGLEYGADDYVTKPFNILEVKARMKAIMRRSRKDETKEESTSKIVAGELVMNRESRTVAISGKDVNLTVKEFDLLELLLLNPGKVYSREELMKLVWGYEDSSTQGARTVDVHVRRLREKIEKVPSEPQYVSTKWSKGYYFKGQK